MRHTFLRFLYLRYPRAFQDFMVEDLIGQIPADVREPSVAFLSKGRDILTRYFLFQSYSIQRRAISDVANAERFHGMLVFMKFLMALVENSQPRASLDSVIPMEEEENPLDAVAKFAAGMKERADKVAE